MTVADNKYFKLAEENLYAEMAVTLKMDKDDVKKYVTDRVKAAVQEK